jgi:hypothetical protein
MEKYLVEESSLVPRGAPGALGFEMLAASLRADEADARAFMEALAAKLGGALPVQTRVERARDGLFSSSTHVARISVELGGWRYQLASGKRGGLEASRARIVRGVAIKSEPCDLDAWIEAMARDLADYAASSASARAALERLVT